MTHCWLRLKKGWTMQGLALLLAVLALVIAVDAARAAGDPRDACYVKDPADTPWLDGRVLKGRMETKCRIPTQSLGLVACMVRYGSENDTTPSMRRCVTIRRLGSVHVKLTVGYRCDYTTYRYLWRVEGYAFVTAKGQSFTSPWVKGKWAEVDCH